MSMSACSINNSGCYVIESEPWHMKCTENGLTHIEPNPFYCEFEDDFKCDAEYRWETFAFDLARMNTEFRDKYKSR